MELIKVRINKENIATYTAKTKLIEKFEMLCNKKKLEEQFYSILNTIKESFISSAHHSSFRLEHRDSKYIKEYLLKEFKGIFEKAQNIPIEVKMDEDENIINLKI